MTKRLSPLLKRPLITALSLVLAVEAFAHEPVEPSSSPAIRVSATATIRTNPDQVQIDLGVITEARTAQAAATQNARQVDKVLTTLREDLGEEARIETSGYSLRPTYHAPKAGEPPAIAGYTAVNGLRVTLDDLPQLGPVLDLALRAGANRMDRLEFTLKDEQAVRLQALRDAVGKAQAQADALAGTLGVRVGRVLAVVESEPTVVRPFREASLRMRADSLAGATLVEPGLIEVQARVTLSVAMEQQPILSRPSTAE
jgi:uncharacterized protein YggE